MTFKKHPDGYEFEGTDGNLYLISYEMMTRITSQTETKLRSIKEMREQCEVSEGGGFQVILSLRDAKDIIDHFEKYYQALTGVLPYANVHSTRISED